MDGLNKQEIEYRQSNGLINNEEIKNSRSVKDIIKTNTITLFNIINLALFILVLTTGELTNATFIFSIILNTIIGIVQEIKAKKIIDKLKISTIDKVKVIREGQEQEILPTEILLDDLLVLKQGDSLIVDALIIKSNNCEVDESVITGESNSIIKKDGDKLTSGSIVTSGSCYAKVSSINKETYANNLIKEASKVKDESSYLKKSINNILKVVTILILPVGVSLFISQFVYSGQGYKESVLSSVAGVIGMIPEGLVLLTSISLTVGVIKMASKKVIIQKLNGIELLSCVDVICLDKTGTITDGTMEVKDIVRIDENYNVEEIISNMLIDEVNVTDRALIKRFGQDNKYHIIENVPFSSKRKYSKVVFKEGIYALGALEYLTNETVSNFEELKEHLEQGYRIITLVKGKEDFSKDTNKIIAFIVLKDNIRKNAEKTIKYFKEQDVQVKVISGDNPITVSNILKQINFENYDKYISGNDLPEDFNELKKIVNDYTIFGRVTPYQKQNVIKALKIKNTVGMIGDGVNDILALKEADCGIALASGISAARSVSEVVLTDSDFGVLPSIVNEGRRVVNNIERVSSMYLIKTIYSFIISRLCIGFTYEYPFYPVQLSLISAICVGLPSFFIALEPNYNKIKKEFMLNVFRNALPSGLVVVLNVLFIILFTYNFNLLYEPYRIAIVASTGYLNLRLLHNISKPLNMFRRVLLISCYITFYLALIILKDFLLIKEINFLSLIVTALMIYANSYLADFFEDIYDRVVEIIRKRRKKGVSYD